MVVIILRKDFETQGVVKTDKSNFAFFTQLKGIINILKGIDYLNWGEKIAQPWDLSRLTHLKTIA